MLRGIRSSVSFMPPFIMAVLGWITPMQGVMASFAAHSLFISQSGLLTTVAYSLPGGPTYALEGSIAVTGAAVQWLRDNVGLIQDAAETELRAHHHGRPLA